MADLNSPDHQFCVEISVDEVDELLHRHVATDRDEIGQTATASAIQAAAATPTATLYTGAFGSVDLESTSPTPIDEHTPFDIASLTKALVGSILAMQAVDEGFVDWDTPIADIMPVWADRPDELSHSVTFLQILNHSSGLPAWRKFYLEHPIDPSPQQARKTRQAVLKSIVDTPLEGPPGMVHAYSDLGYLLLARLLELIFDDDLYQLVKRRIIEPLGLQRTRYVDVHHHSEPIGEAVVTEVCPLRKRVVRGTVHDENTNIIGGTSTHAGLFSTASEVLQFGLHLLAIDAGDEPPNQLVSRETLQFAWSTRAGSEQGSHLAGWDTPSGAKSSAGRGFSPAHTVGHLGFTGTSLWIERRQKVVSVLLSNRVYPTRENDRIRDLRIAFQEKILPPNSTDE